MAATDRDTESMKILKFIKTVKRNEKTQTKPQSLLPLQVTRAPTPKSDNKQLKSKN